jgi:serine protease Do
MLTRRTTPWLAALALAALWPAPAPAADPLNQVVEKANRKMVKVFGAGGFSRLNNYGTGIVITKDGYVLTVASQLLDTADLVVHLYDGTRLRAKVVAAEPELEVALFNILEEKL